MEPCVRICVFVVSLVASTLGAADDGGRAPDGRLHIECHLPLSNLATFVAEELVERQPGMKVETEPGREREMWPPATAALIAHHGAGNIVFLEEEWGRSAAASRRQAWTGDGFHHVPVAVSGARIIVHAGNPIGDVSLADLDALFGRDRRRGRAPVATWGELGVEGPLAARPPSPLSRPVTTGAMAQFWRLVLLRGPMSPAVPELPGGTTPLLAAIAGDPASIGVIGAGWPWDPAAVRDVQVRTGTASAPVPCTETTLLDGSYPIAWRVWLRIPLGPDGGWSAHQDALLRLLTGREGEAMVRNDFLIPIPP